jgi:hypothetical protein
MRQFVALVECGGVCSYNQAIRQKYLVEYVDPAHAQV